MMRPNYKSLRFLDHCVVSALILLCTTRVSYADPRAAEVSPFSKNPATTSRLDSSSAALELVPLTTNEVKLRYVGYDTINKKSGSIVQPTAGINAIILWKPSSSWTLGLSDLLPPVAVNAQITEVPIVILKQVSFVNIAAKGKVDYGFNFFAAHSLSDRWALGMAFTAQKISVSANAATLAGEEVLTGTFAIETSRIALGIHNVPDKRIQFGLTAGVISVTKVTTDMETPLTSSPTGESNNSGSTSSTMPLSDLTLGSEVNFSTKVRVITDLVWKRADKSQSDFSTVDLVEKKKDIHDTLSVFNSVRYRSNPRQEFLVSTSYEPSSVGSGSPGEAGLSGFGTKETVLLYSGFADLYPAWTLGLGVHFGRKAGLVKVNSEDSISRPKVKAQSQDFLDRARFGFGVVYRKASLGVDSNGEQPAAYSQTKIGIPISVAADF